MKDALLHAASADPGIKAGAARTKAARAGLDQADRLPNPSIGLMTENVGGDVPYDQFHRAETTLSLQFPVELGGKRAARTSIATGELEAAGLKQQIHTLDLFYEVELAWDQALVAQYQTEIARDRLQHITDLKTVIDRRVRAARDPAFAGARAEALLGQAKAGFDLAQETAHSARVMLASYWHGSADFSLDTRLFSLSDAAPATPEDEYTPDQALLVAQSRTATARTELEKARSIPDPAVQLGVRHFNADGSYAFILGLTLPVPIFDSNSGNIARATSEAHATDLDIQAFQMARARKITHLRQYLHALRAEDTRLSGTVIPAAEKSVRLVREGMLRGGFSYLDASESLQLLYDAQSRRAEVWRKYLTELAMLNRLTGRHLTLLRKNP